MWRQGGWSPESGRILACDRPDWHKPPKNLPSVEVPGVLVQAEFLVNPLGGLAQEFQAAVEAILDFGDDLVVQVKDRRQGGQELPLAVPGSFLVFHLEVPPPPGWTPGRWRSLCRVPRGICGWGATITATTRPRAMSRRIFRDCSCLPIWKDLHSRGQPNRAQTALPCSFRRAILLCCCSLSGMAHIVAAGAAGFWRRAS